MPEVQLFDFDTLKNHALPPVGDGALLLSFDEARPGAALLQARAAQRAGCRELLLPVPPEARLQLALALPDVRVMALDAAPPFKPLAAALDGRIRSDAPAGLALALRLSSTETTSAPKSKKAARVLLLDEAETNDATLDALSEAARTANAPCVLPGVQTHVALSDGALHRVQGRAEAGSSEPHGALLGDFGSDVLLGLTGGLLTRGLSPDSAALWAASIYAVALESAVQDGGEDSVGARDLVERLAGALRFLKKSAEPKKPGGGFGLLRG